MRAAMIGGAGYYAGKKVSEGREDDAYRDQRIAELEQQQAAQAQMQAQAPPPAAPVAAPVQSAGISDAAIEQIRKLGELHEQGILTDDEFSQKKQELLGG
jgi:hypothetical protein